MLTLKAIITWKSVEEGGLSTIPTSGLQPSFSVAHDLIISKILYSGGKEMQPGISYEVTVELPYGENYDEYIKENMAFTLNIGSRIIATGIVKKKN